MARDDWVAIVTDPAAEYVALVDLQRYGLAPYLPQGRRRTHPTRSTTTLLRKYPLFPRYILLELRGLRREVLPLCRGVRKVKPILASADGEHLWRAPAAVIDAIREGEARGDFDELMGKGDPILISKGVLAGVEAILASSARRGRVEVLLPLFGGVPATVAQGNVMRA